MGHRGHASVRLPAFHAGGVRPRDFQPAYLALQVLAVNSGGQVSQDDKIEKAIERFAGYAGVFYTVTFYPRERRTWMSITCFR